MLKHKIKEHHSHMLRSNSKSILIPIKHIHIELFKGTNKSKYKNITFVLTGKIYFSLTNEETTMKCILIGESNIMYNEFPHTVTC